MASRLFARRHTQDKKATTLVSKQSLERAIQAANALVDQLMEIEVHDDRLDQLEEAISFLTSVLSKSPVEMQQEGASSLEDYLDDAVMPDIAQKIKQDVDMIAKMKNSGSQAPVMASGSDNWVSDRDANGEAKEPILAEVPRLAAAAALHRYVPQTNSRVSTANCATKQAAPWKAPSGLPGWKMPLQENYDHSFEQFQSYDEIYSIAKRLGFRSAEEAWERNPMIGGSVNPNDLKVIKSGSSKQAAPVPVPPAAKPAPSKASADITQLNSDTLAKIQKALAGTDDLMNDKAAQAFIAAIAEELMNRPVEVEQEKPAAPAAAPMPMAASLIGGLKLAFFEDDEEEFEEVECPACGGPGVPLGGLGNRMHYRCRNCGMDFSHKIASNQGGSFVNDGETGNIVEDGGRTPEIAKAHAEIDDKTGIKVPSTELVTKFAGDMTTNKAVKMTESLATQLKSLYLDSKKITEVLDARPVREAVESIYRAYDMMGEATKVLNKQRMQEEAEEKATVIKEKNKKSSSAMFGLTLAAEDEDKCEGCGKSFESNHKGHNSEYCRGCCPDCK